MNYRNAVEKCVLHEQTTYDDGFVVISKTKPYLPIHSIQSEKHDTPLRMVKHTFETLQRDSVLCNLSSKIHDLCDSFLQESIYLHNPIIPEDLFVHVWCLLESHILVHVEEKVTQEDDKNDDLDDVSL